MRASLLVILTGCLSLLSCARTPPSGQKTLEQRLAELEQSVNGGSPQPSSAELQKEADHDLAEIRSMGLVDRALLEFRGRFPNATVDSCRVSYSVDTNTVWCSIGYKVAGKDDVQDDSFGYRRNSGTNWVLMK